MSSPLNHFNSTTFSWFNPRYLKILALKGDLKSWSAKYEPGKTEFYAAITPSHSVNFHSAFY
jgi:hypothetical protein